MSMDRIRADYNIRIVAKLTRALCCRDMRVSLSITPWHLYKPSTIDCVGTKNGGAENPELTCAGYGTLHIIRITWCYFDTRMATDVIRWWCARDSIDFDSEATLTVRLPLLIRFRIGFKAFSRPFEIALCPVVATSAGQFKVHSSQFGIQSKWPHCMSFLGVIIISIHCPVISTYLSQLLSPVCAKHVKLGRICTIYTALCLISIINNSICFRIELVENWFVHKKQA